MLSFLHLYLLFYFPAFEFVNVTYTSFYIPVLPFHFGCRLMLSFRHPGFVKIHNFNNRSTVWGQYASSYRISSKSVKRLQRCGDLTDFQNGGRPPSWICEIQIIWRSELLRDPFCTSLQNFIKISQTVVEISRFLWFFWFFKFKISTVLPLQRANLHHCGKFHQNGQAVAEIWRFNGFFSN